MAAKLAFLWGEDMLWGSPSSILDVNRKSSSEFKNNSFDNKGFDFSERQMVMGRRRHKDDSR